MGDRIPVYHAREAGACRRSEHFVCKVAIAALTLLFAAAPADAQIQGKMILVEGPCDPKSSGTVGDQEASRYPCNAAMVATTERGTILVQFADKTGVDGRILGFAGEFEGGQGFGADPCRHSSSSGCTSRVAVSPCPSAVEHASSPGKITSWSWSSALREPIRRPAHPGDRGTEGEVSGRRGISSALLQLVLVRRSPRVESRQQSGRDVQRPWRASLPSARESVAPGGMETLQRRCGRCEHGPTTPCA